MHPRHLKLTSREYAEWITFYAFDRWDATGEDPRSPETIAAETRRFIEHRDGKTSSHVTNRD